MPAPGGSSRYAWNARPRGPGCRHRITRPPGSSSGCRAGSGNSRWRMPHSASPGFHSDPPSAPSPTPPPEPSGIRPQAGGMPSSPFLPPPQRWSFFRPQAPVAPAGRRLSILSVPATFSGAGDTVATAGDSCAPPPPGCHTPSPEPGPGKVTVPLPRNASSPSPGRHPP